MIIKSVVRGNVDRRITLFKKERERLRNISKGDILLLRVNGVILIRKILEDFVVSLPRSLPLETNSKIKIEILKHIKPSQGLERSDSGFTNGIVDLKHFIPIKTAHGKNIFVIDDSNKIFVWFPHGGGLKLTCINRFVNKDKLFETIGLLWGDGSIEGVRSIRFTNSEPSLINCVINFFEDIGVSRKMWKSQIIWSGPEEPNEKIKEECKKFWSRVLNLPKENIKSVLWSKGKKNKVRFGSVRIFIDNAVLFEIFVNGVLNWCINKINENGLDKKTLQSILKGILATEGCMTFCNGVIRSVKVSFDPHSDEKNLFRKILHRLEISTLPCHKNINEFSIEGWNNFLKLFMIDGFELSETNQKKFIDGFFLHKSTIFRFKTLKQIGADNLDGIKNKTLERFARDGLITIDTEKITLTQLGSSFVDKLAKDDLSRYFFSFF